MSSSGKKIGKIRCILVVFFLFLSFLAFFSARWYTEVFRNTGFASILFTIFAGFEGTSANLMNDWLENALLPAVIFSALCAFILLFNSPWTVTLAGTQTGRKLRLYPFRGRLRSMLCILVCLAFTGAAATTVHLPAYLKGLAVTTDLYETQYVSPDSVQITFPDDKRNLIYIYVESLETSFLSEELGGARNDNEIPELYELAEQNINFSQNDGVGGWPNISNTTFTVAAMVAQSGGIPLSLPISGNTYGRYKSFMPGLTTITNILHDEGYHQVLMFGSKASFGGRDKFYLGHGMDEIFDYNTALEEGVIPEGYKVWWGFEDSVLFSYAKEKLTETAASGEPFSFTMLTADTHHVGGYFCSLCQDQYPENYDCVFACASRQVSSFVRWIQAQPFYENTTIVVCGDHLSMDEYFFSDNVPEDYERHVYDCFINSAATTEHTKNRAFSPMDMFPTTLAAMGCDIEGDRLGLGVNLFSDQPTLCEQFGTDWLNDEILKNSLFYMQQFCELFLFLQ